MIVPADNSEINRLITKEQATLLRACFLKGETAIQAWQAWRNLVDIDSLDRSSYQLLPQLFTNLNDQYSDKDSLLKIRGVFIHNSLKCKNYLRQALPVLRILRESGIEVSLVKGTALVFIYDANRAIEGIEILVHPDSASKAIDVLNKAGWRTPKNFSLKNKDAFVSIANSLWFIDEQQNRIQLNWHLLPECMGYPGEDNFWAVAESIRIKDFDLNTICATDLLLQICIPDYAWHNAPVFSRAAGAITLLRTPKVKIDWQRLIEKAKTYHLILPLRETLKIADQFIQGDIPESIFLELNSRSIPFQEKIEYRLKSQRTNKVGGIPHIVFNYLRLVRNKSLPRKLIGLPEYLKELWSLDNIWRVPGESFLRVFRRIS